MYKTGLFLLITALATAMLAQAPSAYQPVGTMSQLMISVIYPTSDAVFYVDRDEPKTDLQWNTLANQSLTLAESGNLLLMPGRARDQGNWAVWTKAMIDAGTASYKAAQAHNLDGVRAVNDKLYASCVGCHQQYRTNYPGARKPAQ
jgi:cytochrome c556